ncbi:MAG: hypothetical protein ABEH78_05615 [Haloferacaceae archaeon]
MADTDRRLVYVTLDRAAAPRSALERAGYAVVVERTVRGALDRLIGDGVAGVVIEDRTPSGSVVEFLRTIRSRRPDVPVVVYARDGDESLAAETVAAGATEYVPAGTGRVLATIWHAPLGEYLFVVFQALVLTGRVCERRGTVDGDATGAGASGQQ